MPGRAGRETDPMVGFQFGIDFKDKVTGYFTECSGLESETEVVEHKVVGAKGQAIVQKVPGRLKFGNITLKRGITADTQIWLWRQKVEQGNINEARVTGSIIMYDYNFEEVARWTVTNAWPSKVSGPQFKTDGNEFGIEELTLVHEGFKREK
ncbi:MAG TPA: phage tail protein [Kouleothrix sp.]|uniref:phage tail protein n=1 Tax=Kouleothrix sp. TaxID=2779161 RepID=UPI002CD0B9A1|nr:phage tail protein [Kouleothrix sp.]HRC75025.1 phage tail protein [Kouleothrix sp.]